MSTATTLLLIVLVSAASLVRSQTTTRGASGPNPQRTSSERSENMKINIRVGGKVLTGNLSDNATARDFASVLPLKVSMNDLFGREKYGDLPKGLFRTRSQENSVRSRRHRLLVSGSPVRCLLPSGRRVDTFARHHPHRKDRRWGRCIQRAGIGESDH